jgi:hypothetical protein
VWLNTVKEIAPNGIESMLLPEGWFKVKEAVIAEVGIPL